MATSTPSLVPDALIAGGREAPRSATVTLLVRAARTPRGRAGTLCVGIVLAIAAIGPAVAPDSPTAFVTKPFASPSGADLLGGDVLGRDVLSRVLCGGWQILAMAAAATLIGIALGVLIGAVAAYAQGVTDMVLMRLVDVVLAFPPLVFALLLVSIIGPKIWLIVLAVAISHAPQVARVMRSAALDVCERDFVKSVELIGIARWRVVAGEIVPNLVSPLMVETGLRMTFSVVIIAGLSFLGFGLQPPSPNWGAMINENRVGMSVNPWGVLAPVLLLALLTIGLNLFTDAFARVSLGVDRRQPRRRGRRERTSAISPEESAEA